MPLTAKGEEILASLKKQYGSEAKAKQVLYAGKNKGTFTGIDDDSPDSRMDEAMCRIDELCSRLDAYCARTDAINTNVFATLRSDASYTTADLQRIAAALQSGAAPKST